MDGGPEFGPATRKVVDNPLAWARPRRLHWFCSKGPWVRNGPGRWYLYRRLGDRAETAVPSGVSVCPAPATRSRPSGCHSSSRANELRPSAPRRAVPWDAAGPVPDDSTGHALALCPPRPPLAHGTGGSVPSFEKLAQLPGRSSGQHERRVASLWTDRGCAAGSGLQSSKLVDNWAWRDGDAASIVGPARRGPGSETDPGRWYLYRRLGHRAEPAVPSGVSISVGCSDGWRRRRPSARRPGTWLA